MRHRPGRQPPVDLIQRPAGPHRGQDAGQPVPAGPGVVHVPGRHHGQPELCGQFGEGVVAFVVLRVPVMDQLHRDALRAEQCDEPVQFTLGGCYAAVGQGGGYLSLAASGQHHHPVT